MADEPERKPVHITLPGSTPLPAAEGANYFHFTVVAGEVQLLVGTVNLLRIHEIRSSGEVARVVPQITHRFLLSSFGFRQLKGALDEIVANLIKDESKG